MAARHLTIHGGNGGEAFATARTDNWWLAPVVTLLVLLGFIVYATWALFQGNYYYAAPYLSPLYAPVLFADPGVVGGVPLDHAWFGSWPSWLPNLVPRSPAALILIFPLSFRFTCYYYRKSYYRAFVGSPPACAVNPAALGKAYSGETKLLLLQNIHRYALYFALCFVVILSYDAAISFWKDGRFGIGVGSVIQVINAVLLAGYTFGCHSFRHLIGGRTDCMSCGQATPRYATWRGVSWLNGHHAQFAWASLVWVAFADVYVRLVSMGIFRDLNSWD